MKRLRVLVIGQTPPPYGGQAIMIEKLVNARFASVEIVHLRMAFSMSTDEIGKFAWQKVLRLLSLLARGLYRLIAGNIALLYYFPAGPMWNPVIRDLLLLPLWRIFAPRVIYHFHAGGISEFLESKPGWFRFLARLAYGRPDVAITLSALNPKDGEYLKAKKIYVVPNAIEDSYHGRQPKIKSELALLYMGVLSEEKGIFVLLEAFSQLCAEGFDVSLHLAGEFNSDETRVNFLKQSKSLGHESRIRLHGLVTDEKKWALYEQADIMCFLSCFRAETFGLSVLEAMMCELPVVAARWRGVQDLVIDNYNGFLVPIRDTQTTIEKLRALLRDPMLREKFGKNGRARYLKEFTIEKHLRSLETVILETARG